ncbi:hypothetical protein NLJ89_g5215 [Agrocybe chaxingu]|uniref:Complex 1 LYR protein domain-containing protein n=1 Tax=Agrocybe chaxingu TaxID=84603 RepID=A0A9W8K1G1_9AGAR|nr:hypothetical protein NLJ89_g5215 [Agrocybe chaxingu]
MTTIPSRLATLTRTSPSASDARKRVLKLYRDWYRAAPEICSLYSLSQSLSQVRHALRHNFEKNRHVTDPRAIDVLVLKGRQDYQETMNCWKQTDHVVGILLESKDRPQRTFLQKFYEGRDEEAIVPAASGI